MSRYVIIGAGAVGASLAAQFESAGIRYLLVGRGAQIEHLAQHGLHYVTPSGPKDVALETADTAAGAVSLRSTDTLAITTKAQDVEDVARDWAWRPLEDSPDGFAADLPVVTVQNGLDSERILLRRFGRVYGGSLLTPARYTRTGEVVIGSATPGVVTLGRYPTGSDEVSDRIATDLRRAGYVVQTTDDVRRWKVAKLLHSVKNGLEVLSGESDQRARLGALVEAEARAVFAAAGLGASDMAAERTENVSGFRVDPASGINPGQQSTWQSFARGTRSTEVDYLNGEVVLLGRLHGVPTPLNSRLQAVLGGAADRSDPPGTVSLNVLEQLDSAASGLRV